MISFVKMPGIFVPSGSGPSNSLAGENALFGSAKTRRKCEAIWYVAPQELKFI